MVFSGHVGIKDSNKAETLSTREMSRVLFSAEFFECSNFRRELLKHNKGQGIGYQNSGSVR